jgi:antitoxin VapB
MRSLAKEEGRRYYIRCMALNIKDEATDKLAREVAKRAGESITEAIRIALKERLQRLSGRQRAATQREKLYEILQRVDALPRKTDLTDDEILGYDEHGIPR